MPKSLPARSALVLLAVLVSGVAIYLATLRLKMRRALAQYKPCHSVFHTLLELGATGLCQTAGMGGPGRVRVWFMRVRTLVYTENSENALGRRFFP